MRRARCTCGQASVELLALLPLVAVVAAAAFHVLAAGAAAEAAGAAAEAGAVALLQDRDAGAAVRASLASWPRSSTTVRIAGRRISVTVRPRGLRILADRLTARSSADAGPTGPGPRAARPPVRGGDGQLARGGDGRLARQEPRR